MTADPDDWSDPRRAALYDLTEGGRPDLDHYEAIVGELDATSILDVGCGTGTLALRLARSGHDVVGVDPSGSMLDVARRQPTAERVDWIRGTTADLPTLDVDLAIMTGNVAQVFVTDSSWSGVLADVHRVLAPAGHLVFETRVPERPAWEEWTPDATRRRIVSPDLGEVETWCDVLVVDEPLVTFRWTFLFDADGSETTATSTLRFRDRDEIEASLSQQGFSTVDVREAPDRPGKEWVFVARRSG